MAPSFIKPIELINIKKSSLLLVHFLIWGGPARAAIPPSSNLKEIAAQVADTEVRVRIESSQKNIELTGKSLKVQGTVRQFAKVAAGAAQPVERIKISSVTIAKKIFWKVDHLDGHSTRTELLSEPLLAIEGTDLKNGSKSLPPKIFLAVSKKKIDLIGVLPLERYLVGVLASEMPLRWPEESLKAQAVAARSYSLAVMKERKSQLFQLESSIKDQVFRHVSAGIDYDPLIQRAFEAVKATEGQILVTSKNNIFKAFYHADCGGSTSSAKSVWGFGDASPGAVDESCPTNPLATWSLQLSQKALTEKLAQVLKETRPEVLVASLEPKRLTHGMRADAIDVELTNGKHEVLLADTFRAKLGYAVLKSTHFEVQKNESQNGTEFVFSGRGFGHGVGLCQWGSRQMAANNKTYLEILKHYYPQAELR